MGQSIPSDSLSSSSYHHDHPNATWPQSWVGDGPRRRRPHSGDTRRRGAHYVEQAVRDQLIEHRQFITTYGEDLPEIRDWMWTVPKATCAPKSGLVPMTCFSRGQHELRSESSRLSLRDRACCSGAKDDTQASRASTLATPGWNRVLNRARKEAGSRMRNGCRFDVDSR
jgi:hypothetical protein